MGNMGIMPVEEDTKELPKQGAPPISEFGKWCSFHVTNDWPTIRQAPLGLLGVLSLILFVSWLFVWKVVVPEKNEQLNTKDGVIQQKEATIQAKDATIQQLQNALAVNGLNTIPLKKRIVILAEQLEKFAENYPANSPEKWTTYTTSFESRFQQRIANVIYECDQQGAHLDALDSSSDIWNRLREFPIKTDAVRALAGSLTTLAGQLKD